MIRRTALIILILILLAALGAWFLQSRDKGEAGPTAPPQNASATEKRAAPEGWENFENRVAKYSFAHPKEFTVVTGCMGDEAEECGLVTVEYEGSADSYPFEIRVERNPSQITDPKEFAYAVAVTPARISAEEMRTVAGSTAFSFTYTNAALAFTPARVGEGQLFKGTVRVIYFMRGQDLVRIVYDARSKQAQAYAKMAETLAFE